MTFLRLFEDVNAEFLASYEGAPPKGSPRKDAQMARVFELLQDIVLENGLIHNSSRAITLPGTVRQLELRSLDPPIGTVNEIAVNRLPLAVMLPLHMTWQDPTTEGTVMAYSFESPRTITFWPIPDADLDVVINCTEGLASTLATTGDLPFTQEEGASIASLICHLIAARPDVNLLAQARRNIGYVRARRLSETLDVYKR